MSISSDALYVAKSIYNDCISLGFSKKITEQVDSKICLYDEMITNGQLRKKTEKLFKDGHHARAVEEAFKLLDNYVKKKASLENTDKTGQSLMQHVFSPNRPILKFNEGQSTSEKDEQTGYMSIYSGCMTGIRNPRAHDSDWEDTEDRALQLLVLANHLIEKTQMAEKISLHIDSI